MLWPAFTAASTDPSSSLPRESEGPCVVFKVHAQRARPIRDFAHYSFKGDLLLQPRTTLRVKAYLEPTAHNLRQGTPNAVGDFKVTVAEQVAEELNEGCGREVAEKMAEEQEMR